MKITEKAKTIFAFAVMIFVGFVVASAGIALVINPMPQGVRIMGGILTVVGIAVTILSVPFLSIRLKGAKIVDARKGVAS